MVQDIVVNTGIDYIEYLSTYCGSANQQLELQYSPCGASKLAGAGPKSNIEDMLGKNHQKSFKKIKITKIASEFP